MKTQYLYCNECADWAVYYPGDEVDSGTCQGCGEDFCRIHYALHECGYHKKMSANEFRENFDVEHHHIVEG